MLRRRSNGVAKNSLHMQGKAMDFFIPGVPLAKLRAIGLRMQIGGVGFYPTSGSPFVHMDTGSVRQWPRMTRQQLVAVFPNGKTHDVSFRRQACPVSRRGAGRVSGAQGARCRGSPIVAVASSRGWRPSRRGRCERRGPRHGSDRRSDRLDEQHRRPRRRRDRADDSGQSVATRRSLTPRRLRRFEPPRAFGSR